MAYYRSWDLTWFIEFETRKHTMCSSWKPKEGFFTKKIFNYLNTIRPNLFTKIDDFGRMSTLLGHVAVGSGRMAGHEKTRVETANLGVKT